MTVYKYHSNRAYIYKGCYINNMSVSKVPININFMNKLKLILKTPIKSKQSHKETLFNQF